MQSCNFSIELPGVMELRHFCLLRSRPRPAPITLVLRTGGRAWNIPIPTGRAVGFCPRYSPPYHPPHGEEETTLSPVTPVTMTLKLPEEMVLRGFCLLL